MSRDIVGARVRIWRVSCTLARGGRGTALLGISRKSCQSWRRLVSIWVSMARFCLPTTTKEATALKFEGPMDGSAFADFLQTENGRAHR